MVPKNQFSKSHPYKLDMPAKKAYIVYMEDIHTVQYTIRGIPEKINLSLRNKAKKEHKSLNQVVIECLSRGLGLSGEKIYYHDLDDLAGTWQKDPEFDKVIEEMDKIDQELWK